MGAMPIKFDNGHLSKIGSRYEACTLIQELFQPVRLFFLESLSFVMVIQDYTVIKDIRVCSGQKYSKAKE